MLPNVIYTGKVGHIDWKVCESDVFIAFCGYVRLPADHPWRGMEDWTIPVDVHGGVTYGPDDDGWIGFDTLHAGDAHLVKGEPLPSVYDIQGRFWSPQAVKIHTVNFALQADDAYMR